MSKLPSRVLRPLGRVTSSIPKPLVPAAGTKVAAAKVQTPEEQEVWMSSLAKLIFDILSRVEPKEERRIKYVSPEAMMIWARAFTYESYDPNFNYESLEYLGDKILGEYLTSYVMAKRPDISHDVLSELNRLYADNKANRGTSKRLGLDKYVRLVGLDQPSPAIISDLFEAFIGGLYQVGDLIFAGLGGAACRNFVYSIFDEEGIDLEAQGIEGAFRTVLSQIFTRFTGEGGKKLDNPVAVTDKGADNQYHTVVSLLPEHLTFLLSQGIQLPSSAIGRASGTSKRASEEAGYQQALNTLANYGVNKTWAEETKETQDTKGTLETLKVSAKQRYIQDGYTDLTFKEPSKMSTQGGKVIILYGVKNKDGIISNTPIGSTFLKTSGTVPVKEAKAELLRKYISGEI